MTEKFNVICKDYPTRILMEEERKNEYYNAKTDKVPDYVQRKIDKKEFYWGNDFRLYSKQPIEGYTQELRGDNRFQQSKHIVIKNIRSIGKPKYKKISGQAFWVGGEEQIWLRVKIKNELEAYFAPIVGRQLPLKIFPPSKDHFIQLEFIFFTQIYLTGINTTQDVNNHSYPYIKVFQDVLQKMKVIDTDAPSLYRGDYYRYVEIPEGDESRLEIKFHFVTNNEIISR